MARKLRNFERRVAYASRIILANHIPMQRFADCVEMGDGAVVIEAIRRSALRNPRMAQNVKGFFSRLTLAESARKYGHLKRHELPAAAQAARADL